MIPVLELSTLIWRAVRGALFSTFGIVAAFTIVGGALSAVFGWGVFTVCDTLNTKIADLLTSEATAVFDGEEWAFVYDLFNLQFLIGGLVVVVEALAFLVALFPTILSGCLGVAVASFGWRSWRQAVNDFMGGGN